MVTTLEASTFSLINAQMAQQYPRSPIRIPLTDMNPIKSGLDRAEKFLQKGIATPPSYGPAIKTTSHPIVEAAQIHSITKASFNVPIDEDRPSSVLRSSGNGLVVDKHGAKQKADVMPETWTDSSDSNNGRDSVPCKRRSILVGQRSVYGTEDYGWPLLPNSPNKQAIRVGERSVYGTDPFQDPILVLPTAQNPPVHAAYDNGHLPPYASLHTYDWSENPLVTSEAKLFVKLGHLPTRPNAENALLVPRKRASPGKKPFWKAEIGGSDPNPTYNPRERRLITV